MKVTKLLEIASKNDPEKLFEMAPKKISETINAVTAAAAGVKIESWIQESWQQLKRNWIYRIARVTSSGKEESVNKI